MNFEWEWQQENARLRKTLMFYANKNNYRNAVATAGSIMISNVQKDGGALARAELEVHHGSCTISE